MQFEIVLFLGLSISAMSFASTPSNVIKSCELQVSEKGKTINLEIPAQFPGALLKDGAYCDDKGMQIHKKFNALDGSSWTLSLYADRDRNLNTHFIHRIYESGTKEPPQVDLVLNQSPCAFIDKNGTGLSASLKSSKGNEISIKLSCRK